MNDDDAPVPAVDAFDGPLPNRLTRGTMLGCVGLAGVLILPLVLFLPLDAWDLPRWAFLLLQLAAFCAFGGGLWLLARMPAAVRIRSNDPMHPLTARGDAPMVERPAERANRLGVTIIAALALLALAGFALAAFTSDGLHALAVGMALDSLVGLALIVFGVSIALGRLPSPALTWVRTPATSTWLPQGGSLMLAGATLTGWALLIAMEARFIWGAIGLVVLLLAILLVGPALRRVSPRVRQPGE
jgi:hypothetical protein